MVVRGYEYEPKFAFCNQGFSPYKRTQFRTLYIHMNQIKEINAAGQLREVPMHREHILFEDQMYLCTHIFSDGSGKRVTEVYLWTGDGVALADIESAERAAHQIARDLYNASDGIVLPGYLVDDSTHCWLWVGNFQWLTANHFFVSSWANLHCLLKQTIEQLAP